MPVVVSGGNTAVVKVIDNRTMKALDARSATVVTRADAAVNTSQEQVRVLEVGSVGAQGAKGDPGAPGAGGDRLVVNKTASGSLGGHRIVRSAAGLAAYASSFDAAHGDDLLGLTLGAAADGAPVQVLVQGEVTEPSWAWTPGEPLFLHDNGQISQTPPTDPAFEVVVGFAQTATTVYIDIGTPIYSED